jgi:hypothetical protein
MAPSLPQVKKTLLDNVEGFFNSQSELFPDLCDIHLGLYYKDKATSPDARTERLSLSTPFYYKYDTTTVTVSELADFTKFVYRAPQVFNGSNFSPAFGSFIVKRRADLIWDTEAELLASRFPFTDVVTNLSHATRVKIYGTILAAIRKPESSGGPVKGFFAAAAQSATYDHTEPYRNYYPKWRVGEPEKAEDKVFSLERLSDQYLKLNFIPLELQKDGVYLLLEMAGGIRVLFRLFRDPTGRGRRLERTLLHAQGVLDDRNILGLLSEILNRQSGQPPPKLLFLYALDGSLGLPGWLSPQSLSTGKLVFADEEVIDPRYHVKRLWNIPDNDPDPDGTGKWTYRHWVKELIRLKFSDRWVWLRDNPYGGRLTPRPNRDDLFLTEIRDAAAEAKGETRKRLLSFIRDAEQDKNLYMIPRGSLSSSYQRVIGSDEHYVYLYHKNIEIVVRINHEVYFEDYFAFGTFLKVVYRDTKAMIPFGKLICWGGVAVMGVGIFGTAALAEGIRLYLRERLSSAVLKPAIQKFLRKFETELLMMFVNSVLAFFPQDRNTAVVRGFLTGYTTDTFEALFSKWSSLASLEPTSVKVLRYGYKIQAALGKLDDRMSQLKSSVDDQTAKALEDRFVHFLVSMWKTIVMLAGNLQYLDYDQVKPLLDILAKLGQKAPTTKQEWDRVRHDNMLKSLTEFDKTIREAKTDLADLYADARTAAQLGRKALWLANVAFAANKASGGMLTDIVVLGPLAGVGVGAAVVADPQTAKKVAGAGLDLFVDEWMQLFNKYGPKELERFGRLLGRFVAALSLNKKLFGPKMSMADRWKFKNLGRRVKEGLVHDELGVSWLTPLVKLLGFHYVIMLEGVIDSTKKVKERWDKLQDEIDEIVLGDPSNWDIFPPDEESFDLVKVAMILVKLDEILTDWLKELAKVPDLLGKIELMAAKLKRTTPPQVPTLEEIIDGKIDADWSREALTFVMLWSLHAVVDELTQGLRYFTETVNPKGLLALSLAELFELLDFQLRSDEVATILDSNMDALLSSKAAP